MDRVYTLIEEVPTWLSAKNLRHPNELNTTRSAEASPGSIRVSIGAFAGVSSDAAREHRLAASAHVAGKRRRGICIGC